MGSLMYSPTVNNAILQTRADTRREFEWLRHFANVLWAVSFFLFPVGVGLFLFDRWVWREAVSSSLFLTASHLRVVSFPCISASPHLLIFSTSSRLALLLHDIPHS